MQLFFISSLHNYYKNAEERIVHSLWTLYSIDSKKERKSIQTLTPFISRCGTRQINRYTCRQHIKYQNTCYACYCTHVITRLSCFSLALVLSELKFPIIANSSNVLSSSVLKMINIVGGHVSTCQVGDKIQNKMFYVYTV